ncbi:MAG TPA: hypothetical protein VGA98_03865 [Allosphingosinicella sp.]|jgi:uncharacterized protein with ACT and thioredoxin-like domain
MRYFFHLRESGDYVVDEEGRELPDIAAVEAAARLNARSVLAGEAMTGKLPLAAIIEVRDEQGQPVLDLPFRDAVILDG